MTKEFKLSDKKALHSTRGVFYSEANVKEFIKRLKEVLSNNPKDEFRDINMLVIDKLTGDLQ